MKTRLQVNNAFDGEIQPLVGEYHCIQSIISMKPETIELVDGTVIRSAFDGRWYTNDGRRYVTVCTNVYDDEWVFIKSIPVGFKAL